MKEVEHERRDWIIILIIILFGFLCVLLAGERALRSSPRWSLPADMGSKLNPDSGFQSNHPVELVEAIDPAIQTKPVWMDSYLTPGAVFPTRVRPTKTPIPTSAAPTQVVTATNTPVNTPTNTLIYIPATSTAISQPAATKTFTPVPTSTRSSTSTPTRTPTRTSVPTRTPTATNTPTRTPNYTATPTVTGTQSLTPTATNTPTPTNSPTPTSTSTPTNTPTSTNTPTATSTPTSIPTNTPTFTPTSNAPDADLAISIDDGKLSYLHSSSITYSIVVTNNGPKIVVGAPVTIKLSPNLQNVSWSCSAAPAASCTPNGSGSINISDAVTLPNGVSVTYTVNAAVIAEPSGTLDSTATVSVPAGMNDPDLGNNTATDSDMPGEIGIAPDANVHYLRSGDSLVLGINLQVDGSSDGWDLVYYELPYGSGVLLDWMEIEISKDGSKWYRIFYWGDNVADTQSNVDFTKLPPPSIPPYSPDEADEREIPGSSLYSSTGIAIDVDPLVPTGTYNFIRFYAPPGDADGHTEIDAIQILN